MASSGSGWPQPAAPAGGGSIDAPNSGPLLMLLLAELGIRSGPSGCGLLRMLLLAELGMKSGSLS